ncbi:T9SS type A sorting domain-containing protein [Brumimicrobium glaciale]|uniref:T9SS type A sorting domain-containing protein n=1 Tax=Brumimicrobium glaciale TaxID=200475 RepID=A0A4Q4KI85_9FLAO|nr:T9SS type A sorting domain-containing protein [Brumimicrobium glaciale]RYM32357.1 T9SS type A sorting domain-containing protein [Brumimicrobium glaciale]
MKKTLLFLSFLMIATGSIFAQPTTSWDDNADVLWYNAQASDFTLTTEAELAGLSVLVAGGNDFLGSTISIDGAMDLSTHLWSPIGVDATNPFSGTFDGNNHPINGVYVDLPTTSMVGFFGRAINATILNVKLENPTIKGDDSVGSLAGNVWQNGIIDNCHSTGVIIEATGDNVGGLVGDLVENGSIFQSSAQGSVTGGSQVGGLLGSPYNNNTISKSFATGTVHANHLAGGLVGASVIGFPGTLENVFDNCYSRSNVTVVNGYAGGFVGSAAALLSINNSYSTGTAIGPEYDGGFVGGGGNFQTANNYWDTESSQHANAVGDWQGAPGTPDITAKTTTEMKTAAMVSLLNAGDVNGPWKMDANINDGYPSFEQGTSSVTQFSKSNVSMNVYPNLFNGKINIDADADLNSYVIYEISGKVIQEGTLKGKQTTINTQSINSGIYLLMVNTSEGMISKKIVK